MGLCFLRLFLASLFSFGISAANADEISYSDCLSQTNKSCVGLPGTKLTDMLMVSCVAKRTALNCDKIEAASSQEERANFASCYDPEVLCEQFGPKKNPAYSCGEGSLQVVIDSAIGLVSLPLTLLKAPITIPEGINDCYEDTHQKIRYLGGLRPPDMTIESLRQMGCHDIQNFAQLKVDIILKKLEDRRQQEILLHHNEDLTYADMQITPGEAQAINFNLAHAGLFKKVQCYRPEEAAKTICASFTKVGLSLVPIGSFAKALPVIRLSASKAAQVAKAEESFSLIKNDKKFSTGISELNRDLPKPAQKKIKKIKERVQNTYFTSPSYERQNALTNALSFESASSFLSDNADLNRGLLKASGDLGNKAKFAEYTEALSAETFRRMLNSKNKKLIKLAKEGQIDHDTIVQVLIDRHRARGLEPTSIEPGSDLLSYKDFRKKLGEGPIIDRGFPVGDGLKRNHGVYVHLMQLDYVMPSIEEAVGKGNASMAFQYFSTPRGLKYWNETFDLYFVGDTLKDTRFLNHNFFEKNLLNLKHPDEYK